MFPQVNLIRHGLTVTNKFSINGN